jgi:hypothetical protein
MDRNEFEDDFDAQQHTDRLNEADGENCSDWLSEFNDRVARIAARNAECQARREAVVSAPATRRQEAIDHFWDARASGCSIRELLTEAESPNSTQLQRDIAAVALGFEDSIPK